MAAPPEQTTATRGETPDVFTGLLLVAMLLLGITVAAMYFTNSDHSTFDDGTTAQIGGPVSLVQFPL